ncbi:DUF2207 domain-containing protein [Streptococcus koreensis]|uniref:DUF2207 domain-containing protein n=1 Tax=Streptococcus koreensis TaxID=2382163 RepID=UPI0022E160DA|nr:DUF2207 domain-containing protein [Streptococcus koreensis]
MKKILYVLFAVMTCLFVTGLVKADGPSYEIQSYRGTLILETWDDATYEEELVYHFTTSYNGQYVTLGSAGKMPQGFEIVTPPLVEVEGRTLSQEPEVQNLGDGYQVKIYNGGSAGDTVKVKVTWQLKNLLYVHRDILLLNWKPISDGDQGVGEVELMVIPKFASEVSKSELNIHTSYMGPDASIKKEGANYIASLKNLKRKEGVEIYAYWLKSDVASFGESDRDTGLMEEDNYHRTQAGIVQKRTWVRLFMKVLLPILVLLFLLLAIYYRHRFMQSVTSTKVFPKNSRLYEIPNNVAPLLMASIVYSTELDEISPTKKHARGAFKFDQLVQATLLDLIDRKNIICEQYDTHTVLTIQNEDTLDEFEREFLRLAFGTQKTCRTDDLFSDYEISDSLYKYASKKDQDEIRERGKQAQNRIDAAISRVAQAVQQKIQTFTLPSYYRPLEAGEESAGRKSLFFGWAAWSIALVAGLVAYFVLNWLSIFCVMYVLVMWILPATFQGKFSLYQRDGVPTELGAEQRYYWDSFRNMLRDIAHLEEAEIQSLVLWNRLLVYATLFGFADQVSKVMKLRQIHLENPSMDAYVYTPFRSNLIHSSRLLSNYGTTATTASHFTVSSGGSSGGGFSGGGGGGGFGAF